MQSSPLMNEVHAIRAKQDVAFARLGGLTPTVEQQREMANAARRLEHVYADLEMAMPEPGPTDRPTDYEVRLLQPLQKFSTFRGSDLATMARHGALRGVDNQILREATAKAADREQGSFKRPGALREIRRTDSGGNIVDYYGAPSAWMASFMSPVRLAVESFKRR